MLSSLILSLPRQLGRPLDLDASIPASLDSDDYAEFAPAFTLDVPAGNKLDMNTEARLVEVEQAFAEYARVLEGRYGPGEVRPRTAEGRTG